MTSLGEDSAVVNRYVAASRHLEHWLIAPLEAQCGTRLSSQLAGVLKLPSARRERLRPVTEAYEFLKPAFVHAHSASAGEFVRLSRKIPTQSIIYSPHGYMFKKLDIPLISRTAHVLSEYLLAARAAAVPAPGRFPHRHPVQHSTEHAMSDTHAPSKAAVPDMPGHPPATDLSATRPTTLGVTSSAPCPSQACDAATGDQNPLVPGEPPMRLGVCRTNPSYHKAAIGLGNASAGGIALDNEGHAYVSNFYTGALNKVDLATGDFTEVANLGQANAVALDGRGSAYITNLYGGSLYKVHLATGLTIATADRIDYSAGVAVSSESKAIYVVSALGRLYRVDPRSGLRTQIVDDLHDPWGLALDGSGNAYITSHNGYLYVVDLVTKETRIIASGIGDAYGIALDGAGFAFTSTFRDGSVLRVNLETGEINEAAAGLGNPTAMVLDSHGDAYVVNTHGILWKINTVGGRHPESLCQSI